MITGELLAEQSPELMQNLKLSSHQSDRRERERPKWIPGALENPGGHALEKELN